MKSTPTYLQKAGVRRVPLDRKVSEQARSDRFPFEVDVGAVARNLKRGRQIGGPLNAPDLAGKGLSDCAWACEIRRARRESYRLRQ